MTDDTLSGAIADLKDEHLTCRDLGHAWRMDSYRTVDPPDGVRHYLRVLVCRVCTTHREEEVARDGELLKRRYRYQRGYQFPKGVAGVGGLPKFHFRSEWLNRLIKENEA